MKNNIDTIIVRFFERKNTPEELKALEAWLKADDANKKELRHLFESYQFTRTDTFQKNIDIDYAWDKMSGRIKFASKPLQKNVFQRTTFWKVAASVAILICLGLTAALVHNNVNLSKGNQHVEFIAPKGEKSKVILIDGTQVWLNSESKLGYNMSAPRKVNLVGEAFFDVTTNKKSPFLVSTNSGLQVKVHGTRFNVSAYATDKTVETTLEEGKISMEGLANSSPVVLKPGEQLVFNKQTKTVQLLKVDAQLFSIWKEDILKFDNTPLFEVITKIERWYDVEISMDFEFRKEDRLTMTVKTESLRELLNMISLTVKMDYEINGKKVTISNK